MAFPVVLDVTETSITGPSSSWTINLPATVDAGDLLLLFAAVSTNVSNNANPSGFTEIFDDGQTNSPRLLVYKKEADGTEDGGTVTIGFASGREGAAMVIRIQAGTWGGDITNDVAVSAYAGGGTGTHPNSANLAPAWGAADTLWISVAGDTAAGVTYTAPASYGNVVDTSGSANGTIGTARRELNAASENPGAFTRSSTSGGQSSVTVAVEPGAGAGSTQPPRTMHVERMRRAA